MIRPRLGVLAVILAGGPLPVLAQSVTTGALSVAVLDASGAPVVAAAVRIASGQIEKSALTGADGKAFFPLLNPGGWRVSATKTGLNMPSQNVSLAINETHLVNLRGVKENSATVEVVGINRTVDMATTTSGSSLALDTIDALPKGRDVSTLIFLAPGVAGSGFTQGGLNVSINGASGAENSWSVDGLSSTDFRYGGRGTSLNTDFVDQVDIQTGGFKPEFSAMGGVFNVLTKSGTNDFRGSLSLSITPSAFNPAPKSTNFSLEPPATYGADTAFWAGGALVKDRLFYSVGAYGNFSKQAPQKNASGFTSDEADIQDQQYFVKINAYVTPSQQITANVMHTSSRFKIDHDVPRSQGNNVAYPQTLYIFGDAELGRTTDYNTNGASIGYDWSIADNLFLTAKLGRSGIVNPTEPVAPNVPSVYDRHWFQGANGNQAVAGGGAGTLPSFLTDTTNVYHRGGFGLYTREYNTTRQGNLSLTWVLGNHSLKFGYSRLESSYQFWENVSGDHRFTIDKNGGRLRDRVIQNDATVRSAYNAYFLQDTWQLNPHLNVFYGFRAETQDQFDGNGRKFLSFTASQALQPRIGFTYDAKGDGSSKLFGNYAIYYENMPQRLALREFTSEYFKEKRYNSPTYGGTHTGQYVYGPNGGNVGTFVAGFFDALVEYDKAFQFPPIQDGVKPPKREEIQLGYQRSWGNGWSGGLTFKYRMLKDPLEDSNFVDAAGNPLADRNGHVDNTGFAVLWNIGSNLKYFNPHDGVTYDYTGVDLIFPKGYNKYRALEFTLEKKSDRAYFSASYVLSRMEGNYQGLISSSNGQPDANITASFDLWPYVGTGLLPLDHTHTVKLYGTYKFNLGKMPCSAGANFVLQTGSPISHFDDGTATFGDGNSDFGGYGNSTPVNFQLGQFGRRPTATRLDLHLETEISFSAKVKLSPYVDVLNAYNDRSSTYSLEQITDSGASVNPTGYLDSPVTWQSGRSVRIGARLRF